MVFGASSYNLRNIKVKTAKSRIKVFLCFYVARVHTYNIHKEKSAF